MPPVLAVVLGTHARAHMRVRAHLHFCNLFFNPGSTLAFCLFEVVKSVNTDVENFIKETKNLYHLI